MSLGLTGSSSRCSSPREAPLTCHTRPSGGSSHRKPLPVLRCTARLATAQSNEPGRCPELVGCACCNSDQRQRCPGAGRQAAMAISITVRVFTPGLLLQCDDHRNDAGARLECTQGFTDDGEGAGEVVCIAYPRFGEAMSRLPGAMTP
jgi:hypothetical protein